jgi:glucosamine kinase
MIESRDINLIGVDGGGTGCRVAIADSHQTVLTVAEGGRANVTNDFDRALRNLRETLEIALQKSGLDRARLTNATVHLGLAGAETHDTAARIASALKSALGLDHVTVTDDRATTVAGALGGDDGFLAAVGTGSFVASRHDGQNTFVGGYGLQVSDQASAAWLGRRLLEETLLAHDAIRSHTNLTHAILARFGEDPDDIVAFSVDASPADYGKLAPDVVAAAEAGDAVGSALMQEGHAYLKAGLARLGFNPGEELCLTGGVGRQYARYFADTAIIVEPQGSAVAGAVRLAAMAAQQRAGTAP